MAAASWGGLQGLASSLSLLASGEQGSCWGKHKNTEAGSLSKENVKALEPGSRERSCQMLRENRKAFEALPSEVMEQ